MSDYKKEKGSQPETASPSSTSNKRETARPLRQEQSTPADLGREPTFLKLEKAGFDLISLRHRDKTPSAKWRQAKPLSVEKALAHFRDGGNIGVRLRSQDLVIDYDPRHDASEKSLERLKADFDLPDCRTVATGGGGLHLYFSKPRDFEIVGSMEEYPGIDFKKAGGYVVAPGSIHPDGPVYIFDPLDDIPMIPEAPQKLLDALRKPEATKTTEGAQIDPEKLEKMLEGLNPEDYSDHEPWLQLMMACHHATGGAGRQEFVNWSAQDGQYSDHAWIIGRRWDSLSQNGNGGKLVTIKTLQRELHKAGRGDLAELADRDDPEDDFPDDAEEVIEGLVNPKPIDSFWSNWVWVAEAQTFVDRKDGRRWNKETWKSMFADKWPESEILNAVWKGKTSIKRYESFDFRPEAGEFLEEGRVYNLWQKSGVKAAKGDVAVFLEHMEFLFENENERSLILDYLAHLVQRPADKIKFALLIRGAQGTGKSWLGNLLEAIVGGVNVVRPSNDEVTSRWSAWMQGKQLAIVEELMTLGRREIANRLKGPLTDSQLRIEEKGKPLYSVPNRLNFLCFTNHADALPIEHGDRRWFIVFSSARRRDDAYYARLFGFLESSGPAAVKDFLLSRQIKLKVNGVAPRTTGKEIMRRRSMNDVAEWMQTAFEEKSYPFNFGLVRLETIAETIAIQLTSAPKIPNLKSRIANFLDEIGAQKQGRYTKNDNEERPAYQLWSIEAHDKWRKVGASGRIEAYMEFIGKPAKVQS